MLKVYNLTLERFNELMAEQDGKCRLCKREFGEELVPVVDHCHSQNIVRGLLCIPCNRVLGYLENDDWYYAAVEYLRWDS